MRECKQLQTCFTWCPIISPVVIPTDYDLPTDFPHSWLLTFLCHSALTSHILTCCPWNNLPLSPIPRMSFWFVIVCGMDSGRPLSQSSYLTQCQCQSYWHESKLVLWSLAHSQWPHFTYSEKPCFHCGLLPLLTVSLILFLEHAAASALGFVHVILSICDIPFPDFQFWLKCHDVWTTIVDWLFFWNYKHSSLPTIHCLLFSTVLSFQVNYPPRFAVCSTH